MTDQLNEAARLANERFQLNQRKQLEAERRLIAAAPDMLEALEDAEFIMRKAAINPREIYAMRDSLKRSAEAARAAIAKAKGEEE